MVRKTGKSRKKYWKSKELAAKTDEIIEEHKSHELKKQIEAKSDSDLFVIDKSKQIAPDLKGVYSAIPSESQSVKKRQKTSKLAPRNEFESWKYTNEKYEKKITRLARIAEHNDKVEQARRNDIFSSIDGDYWGSDADKLKKQERTPGVFVSEKRKPLSKPNANEHVAVPEGGESYNPSYQDHQKLLKRVLVGEKKEKKKHDEEIAFWKSVPLQSFEEQEAAVMKGVENFYFKQQLPEGLESTQQEKPAGAENSADYKFPTMSNRKLNMTPLQREQHKKKTELAEFVKRVASREKARVSRQNEILNAKAIVKKLSREEVARAERYRKRMEKKKDPKRVKKIGKYPVEEGKAAFKLTEELRGSLRKLVPSATVLVSDRLSSYMKRNILEPMTLSKSSRLNTRQRARLRIRQKRNKKIVICSRNRPEIDALYKSQPKILREMNMLPST